MKASCEVCGTEIETSPSKRRRFCSMACRNRPFAETWEHRVERQDGGCWLWLGPVNVEGYGTAISDGRRQGAHRLVYELLVGPIPEGRQLDHLCRVRRCVNPEHLDPVSQRENILRGHGSPALNARKTHCVNGHEFTDANTGRKRNGNRYCKTCASSSSLGVAA